MTKDLHEVDLKDRPDPAPGYFAVTASDHRGLGATSYWAVEDAAEIFGNIESHPVSYATACRLLFVALKRYRKRPNSDRAAEVIGSALAVALFSTIAPPGCFKEQFSRAVRMYGRASVMVTIGKKRGVCVVVTKTPTDPRKMFKAMSRKSGLPRFTYVNTEDAAFQS